METNENKETNKVNTGNSDQNNTQDWKKKETNPNNPIAKNNDPLTTDKNKQQPGGQKTPVPNTNEKQAPSKTGQEKENARKTENAEYPGDLENEDTTIEEEEENTVDTTTPTAKDNTDQTNRDRK